MAAAGRQRWQNGIVGITGATGTTGADSVTGATGATGGNGADSTAVGGNGGNGGNGTPRQPRRQGADGVVPKSPTAGATGAPDTYSLVGTTYTGTQAATGLWQPARQRRKRFSAVGAGSNGLTVIGGSVAPAATGVPGTSDNGGTGGMGWLRELWHRQ